MGAADGDRRVRRTQARLREAIVELVADKGYQAVTIDHVCERADVTRATFYAHFRDKEHLLASVADDLIDRCLDLVAAGGTTDDVGGERLVVLFEQARHHHQAFAIIVRGEGDGAALRRLRQRLRVLVVEAFGNATSLALSRPVVPLEVVAELFVGEIVGLLEWWLGHDDPHTDARQVVAWLRTTSSYGRLWALGIDDRLLSAPRAAALRAGLPPKEGS